MLFTGTYEHTIDSKQRVAIPAEVRSQVESDFYRANPGEPPRHEKDEPVALYVTLGEERRLCFYTESGFERRAAELDNSELDADELLEYEAMLFSLSRKLEIDGNGRVRLPEQLLSMSSVSGSKHVVIIGAKDHLQIRDREAWNAEVADMLQNRAHMLMNPRLAMRKKRK